MVREKREKRKREKGNFGRRVKEIDVFHTLPFLRMFYILR
jgi:hypothetical protein